MARGIPGSRARHRSSRVRRIRLTIGLLVVVVVGVASGVALSSSSGHKTRATGGKPPAVTANGPASHPAKALEPAVESGLLPWQLSAPISRTVALPGAGNQLVVLGGLTTGNASSSGVYTLDTSERASHPRRAT